MRRTAVLLRGSKGYGWYKKYRSEPEEYGIYTKMTPFNWKEGNIKRPKAYFELESGKEKLGRLEFELASDVLPKTVENFLNLVQGKGPKGFSYKDSKFHYIRKGEVLMGGDVEGGNGKLSHSSHDERFFMDENFIIPHTEKGLLR
jgi:hypothetical protein